jgi:hypothetical protein
VYILDTNLVSELRKAKKAHQHVKKWAQLLPAASLHTLYGIVRIVRRAA